MTHPSNLEPHGCTYDIEDLAVCPLCGHGLCRVSWTGADARKSHIVLHRLDERKLRKRVPEPPCVQVAFAEGEAFHT